MPKQNTLNIAKNNVIPTLTGRAGTYPKSRSMRVLLGTAIAVLPLGFMQTGAVSGQSLESFAVISGSTLTNTGPTTIVGNIALFPGTSYSGALSVTQTGETFIADAVAARQQDRLTTLYTALANRPTSRDGDMTGQTLGGRTLSAGVYNFDSSAGLAVGEVLTLDAGGDPNAVFIFNIGSTLTAESGSSVVLANGAQAGNVFFRVGSSATLNTTSALRGQIVALTSITLATGATLGCGTAFARQGAVTLDTNTIRICTLAIDEADILPVEPAPPVDEPDVPPVEPALPVDEPDVPPVEPAPPVDEPDVTPVEPAPPVEEADAAPVEPAPKPTPNSVSTALSEFVANGGVLPIEVAILVATQTPAELATSFTQLTGEVSSGIAPMGLQVTDALLDTVMRSGRRERDYIIAPNEQDIPVGMVRDRSHDGSGGKYGTGKYDTSRTAAGRSGANDTALSFPGAAIEQLRPWDVWIAGYGSRNTTEGDAGLGYHKLSSDNRGVAAGLNIMANETSDFGVALSWAEADFTLADGFGSGTSETGFLALRGRTASAVGYIEGAIAYGQSDITTARSLTVAGLDQLVGETSADILAAHIEAGYHMGIFTPFAGLRAKSITTDAYSEKAVAGTSSYALDFDKNTTRSLRSELGVAMKWSAANAGSAAPAFGVRAAWAHEFASNDAGRASFQTIPDVSIPITGVSRDKDSLLLAAGVTWAASNGVYLDAGINAEHSKNTSEYGGSLTVGYRW